MTRGWLVVALAGCATGGETDDAVTYWRDVRPILDTHCTRCHQEGAHGTFGFEEPAVVVAYLTPILAQIDGGAMPPAAPDPSCAPYRDAERWALDASEQATLRAWRDAGTPLGDVADAPSAWAAPTLAPWDVDVAGGAAYLPTFAEDSLEVHRCWAVPLENATELAVRGIEARVDPTHHEFLAEVALYRDTAAIWSGGADPAASDGFPCDAVGADWRLLHAAGPGAEPLSFEGGNALRLPPDARLVVRARYVDDEVALDLPAYGLVLGDATDTSVAVVLVSASADVPAGATDVRAHADVAAVGDVIAVLAAMDDRGTDVALTTDGACAARISTWNEHNQVPIVLEDPVAASGGLALDCGFANADAEAVRATCQALVYVRP